jgi:hypothetical protein
MKQGKLVGAARRIGRRKLTADEERRRGSPARRRGEMRGWWTGGRRAVLGGRWSKAESDGGRNETVVATGETTAEQGSSVVALAACGPGDSEFLRAFSRI